jgi:acetyltransferase-like isoleucine patch superfamily enzyme
MKTLLKQGVDLLCIMLLSPLLLLDWLARHSGRLSETVFVDSAQLMSLLPGKFGNYLRKNFFRFAMRECSGNCLIGFGTLFSHRETEILDQVYIGPQCNIGLCRIERSALLGSGVHILSGKGQHNFDDLDTPIQEQGGTFEKITIGEDTWIGNGALIMANVGRKCIVGAGSVVTRDMPDYAIVAGNPARIVRQRS